MLVPEIFGNFTKEERIKMNDYLAATLKRFAVYKDPSKMERYSGMSAFCMVAMLDPENGFGSEEVMEILNKIGIDL